MRILRLILVVLLATSFAVLPVSAAMAMTRAANAEMSMSGPDDACSSCKLVPADLCLLSYMHCCYMQALAAEGLLMTAPMTDRFAERRAQSVTPVSHRPDPPPPRS